MKLYMHPAACSLSPHIVCRELGIPVELVPVERGTHLLPDGSDFSAVNGNGYVPILELDDGTRLIEGPAIVQYLADLRPQSRLAPPAGTMERVRLQSWLNFITSELHKPMAMHFNPALLSARDGLRAIVEKRLSWLATQLAGPFLLGEHFSVADAYLFVVLNWSQFQNLDLRRWPALTAFMQRVAARPGVQAALAAERLVPSNAGAGLFTPVQAAA
jgi:glutathione S-transferase